MNNHQKNVSQTISERKKLYFQSKTDKEKESIIRLIFSALNFSSRDFVKLECAKEDMGFFLEEAKKLSEKEGSTIEKHYNKVISVLGKRKKLKFDIQKGTVHHYPKIVTEDEIEYNFYKDKKYNSAIELKQRQKEIEELQRIERERGYRKNIIKCTSSRITNFKFVERPSINSMAANLEILDRYLKKFD